MDWMKLKSGTDVRGTALGDAPLLTTHVAQCLGMAFARYVAQKAGKPTTQITIALDGTAASAARRCCAPPPRAFHGRVRPCWISACVPPRPCI